MDDSALTKMFSYVGFPQLVKHVGSEDWMKWKLNEETLLVKINLIRPKKDEIT